MLMKHSGLYLLARGLPGIITFLSIAIYTRMMSTGDYGQYALVMAWITLGNAIFYRWIRLGLSRYLSSYESSRESFLATISIAFLCITVLTGILSGILTLGVSTKNLLLIVCGTLLMWAQAWFELALEMARANIKPVVYGKLALVKTLLSLILSIVFIYYGWGAVGLLLGLSGGTLIPLFWISRKHWRISRKSVDWVVFRQLLTYGLPLTLTFALEFVVNSMDRILLAWMISEEVSGMYAVGYDLARQSLGLLLLIINLAAFPLAVKAMNEGGDESVKKQMKENGTVIMLLSFPAAAGLAMLASNMSSLFLGEDFRESAARLIPWISVATLIVGMKTFHFDLIFQLKKSTVHQIWAALSAACTNLLLNLWWIPLYGFMGAAYATVVSYCVALLISILLGRSLLILPFPIIDAVKIAASTLVMALVLWPILQYKGPVALVAQISVGIAVYSLMVLVFNVVGMRKKVATALSGLISKWENQSKGVN